MFAGCPPNNDRPKFLVFESAALVLVKVLFRHNKVVTCYLKNPTMLLPCENCKVKIPISKIERHMVKMSFTQL